VLGCGLYVIARECELNGTMDIKKISWGSCQLYLEFVQHFGYPVFAGYSISTVGTVLYCLVIFTDQPKHYTPQYKPMPQYGYTN
jgi:hypothetical protein